MLTRSARYTRNVACHLFCVALACAASWASAQNLLLNPKFSGGSIAPWGAGITAFDAQSASADGSGSASGTFNVAASGVALAMHQCVPVTAGSYYQFAGKVLIPTGQTTPGSINLYTRWYTSTTCGGTLLTQENVSTDVLSPASANGTWIAIQGDGAAPAGAQSVWLAGAIFKSTTAPLQVKFDELSFQLAPVGNVVLSVTRSGASSGVVTGAGINCGGFGKDCTESLAPNATITLSASPDYYAKFTSWSGGGCSGTAPTCTVTLNVAKTVDAKFDVAPTFPFALVVAGSGAGSVALSTEDASCSSSCNVFIPENKTATLTATPTAGSVFAGWSGTGCSGTGICTVTVIAASTVTATFNLVATVPPSPATNVTVPTLAPALLVLLSLLTGFATWVIRGAPIARR